MHTKLTLRLDEELIEHAKSYARESGKSLSRLVADYFVLLTRLEREEASAPHDTDMPPLVSSLRGSLKGLDRESEAAVEDYRRHLEEKYL